MTCCLFLSLDTLDKGEYAQVVPQYRSPQGTLSRDHSRKKAHYVRALS